VRIMEGEFYKEFVKFNEERGKRGLSPLSRRDFLRATGLAAVGLSLPLRFPRMFTAPSIDPPDGDTAVGIVRRDDIENAVMTAIELGGGLSEINYGDTVVIKPNITFRSSLEFGGIRVVTSPDVLRAVIRAARDRTAGMNITVADACAFGLSTKETAQSCGLHDVCLEEKVNFVAWEEGKYATFRDKNFVHLKRSREIPASLSSFDHFINVPILKNHEMIPNNNANYTCCMKNFVGVLKPSNRTDIHTTDLGEKVAEINLCRPNITMNIVDALTIILSGGPASSNMKTADARLILASKDRVACDSLALAILKYYASEQGINEDYVNQSVWEQAQIKRASSLGLGRKDPAHIHIMSDGVDNIDNILAFWN
jgi:uncharacterized protein (DUF362 family)